MSDFHKDAQMISDARLIRLWTGVCSIVRTASKSKASLTPVPENLGSQRANIINSLMKNALSYGKVSKDGEKLKASPK